LRRAPDLPRTAAPASVAKREMEPSARPASPTVTARTARPATLTVTAPESRPARPTVTALASRPARPTVTAPASRPAIPTAAAPSATLSHVAAAPQESRCLSVNAVPFAEVYVDARPVGYTPMACLRVPVGEHRVHFQMDTQRSPERLLRVTARHTSDAPLRLSFDFNTGRFIEQ
jgi:hypothetical protein